MRTSWPSALSDAVTCALVATFGLLMALIRSPTVSVPVDANVVVLVPSLTVIVPFLGIPRVKSAVFADSGTVPVPVAGEPALAALEEDVAELACEACTALCNAAVSWAWTRVCASLVRNARHALGLVGREVAHGDNQRSAQRGALGLALRLAPEVWSCCQNEMLPKLPIVPWNFVALPNRSPARLLMRHRQLTGVSIRAKFTPC